MEYLSVLFTTYRPLIPYFVLSCVATLLLTPVFGSLAKRLGVIDRPKRQRRGDERGLSSRIHKKPTVRMGGLAVIIPAVILILLSVPLSKPVIGILLGIGFLTIGGVLDDKFELNSKLQILFQLLAAAAVVIFGVGLEEIRTVYGVVDMRSIVIPLTQFQGQQLSFVLPSDLVVIAWILIIINAMKWVFGSDGLGEGVTAIAFLTLLFIGVEMNAPVTAFISIVFLGSLCGFLPYNFYPAKIFTGTTGQSVYGFVIAVMSIFGEAKTLTSLIVLLIPITDMLWVILGRVWRDRIFNPFKLMQISDATHLHHRLRSLGFSVIQVAIIEYILVALTAAVAFAYGDFSNALLLTIVFTGIGIVFLAITIVRKMGLQLQKNDSKINEKSQQDKNDDDTPPDHSPEDRYAY